MRRLALYSDVHGNAVAFEAVLKDIAANGVEEHYCLGDLVGLGPRPNEVVALARESGSAIVQGNYDRAIGAHLCSPGSDFPTPQEELDGAESYGFTVAETSHEAADFLFALPRELRLEEGGAELLLCHGTPRSLSGYVGPDAQAHHLVSLAKAAVADVVCSGHSHVPFHRSIPTENGVVHWVNAGSVGRPRDGDPRASWTEVVAGTKAEVLQHAAVDTACRPIGDRDVWLGVIVHRVAYDVEEVVRDMVRLGLPATLAAGLKAGLEEHDIAAGGLRRADDLKATSFVVQEPSLELACGHTAENCTCMFDDRTAAYEALARVLRGDISEVSAAVRRLRIAMRGCRINRHVNEEAIVLAFEGADFALRTSAGRTAFVEERERLYGLGAGFDPFINVLSPDETTYLAGEREGQIAGLKECYREAMFDSSLTGEGRDPGHISTELAFMAHCLRAVSTGDSRALDRAREFFLHHLGQWGVLFAVVVGQQATEPVMRYAGLALDKHLSCESQFFRQTTAPYGEPVRP